MSNTDPQAFSSTNVMQAMSGSSSSSGSSSAPSNPYAIPATPSWLDSSQATAPLTQELSGVNKFYDVSKYLNALKGTAESQYGIDKQEGQNAAQEQTARSYQNGTYGSTNSAMIAAQTALPGMQNLIQSKSDAAGIALKAGIANEQARAGLVQSIADARTKYAGVLANYVTGIRGQTISGYNTQTSLGIEKQNANTSQASLWASIMNNPISSPAAKAAAAAHLGINNGNFYPGYSGNFGQPVAPATGSSNSFDTAY